MRNVKQNTRKTEKKVHKGEQVRRAIYKKISSGEFAPGGKLPTFDEMGATFDVSRAVLQAAVARLQADGFIRTENRRGLFVADHPPHLFRHAMVFPGHPGAMGWSMFCDVVEKEFKRQVMRVEGSSALFFWNIDEREPEAAALANLKREMAACTLAGVFLMPGTHWLAHEAWVRKSSVPVVYLAAAFDSGCAPNVRTDRDHFYTRAFEFFAKHGHRRVAVLDMADLVYRLELRQLYKDAGLEFLPQWHQLVGRSNPESARGVVHLLMDYPRGKRPDALLVADDNLAGFALDGLADAGLAAGRDIDVVAHCNWPAPNPGPAGVRRLGFDASGLVAKAMDCARLLRVRKKCPADNLIPALFQDEPG